MGSCTYFYVRSPSAFVYSEFVAQKQGSKYFDCISWILSENLFASSSVSHADFIRSVGAERRCLDVGDKTNLAMLKFSLATHVHAPAVQAFYHFYNETIGNNAAHEDCPVWASFEGKQYCQISDLMNVVNDVDGNSGPQSSSSFSE